MNAAKRTRERVRGDGIEEKCARANATIRFSMTLGDRLATPAKTVKTKKIVGP
jgi:hypothetical protein